MLYILTHLPSPTLITCRGGKHRSRVDERYLTAFPFGLLLECISLSLDYFLKMILFFIKHFTFSHLSSASVLFRAMLDSKFMKFYLGI